jgi:hypothetical protein
MIYKNMKFFHCFWVNRSEQFIEDAWGGVEMVGVEPGQFVVAGVADYLFGFEGVLIVGSEDGAGEGLVKPDLFKIEGVSDAKFSEKFFRVSGSEPFFLLHVFNGLRCFVVGYWLFDKTDFNFHFFKHQSKWILVL